MVECSMLMIHMHLTLMPAKCQATLPPLPACVPLAGRLVSGAFWGVLIGSGRDEEARARAADCLVTCRCSSAPGRLTTQLPALAWAED